MNWISSVLAKGKHVFCFLQQIDTQQRLFLTFAVPCLLLTVWALITAGISSYLVAFIIIILSLLATYVFIATKQSSEHQIRTLANLIESMIQGDYSLRGRLKTHQAFQELLQLINQLSGTLARHKIEAKESRLLLERIMEQMEASVFATNEKNEVVMANASANKLVFSEYRDVVGVALSATNVGGEILQAQPGIIEFTQHSLSGEYFLSKEFFLSDGKKHQLYMLTNAERLLLEKERKAWQSLLRVLSHEVNNSLTPIAAISQAMRSSLKLKHKEIKPENLLEGVDIINERAESLSNFIASYSQLSHLDKPKLVDINFINLLKSLRGLFPACYFEIDSSCDVKIQADKVQLEQVLINVFKNAIESMEKSVETQITISTTIEQQWLKISIKDKGKGIANSENVFVPFYTTKAKGSGIGLALSRQIMFNHNGMIKLENTPNERGATVTLLFPLV